MYKISQACKTIRQLKLEQTFLAKNWAKPKSQKRHNKKSCY